MAHRGRLNLLVNVLGKFPADLFSAFDESGELEGANTGDVKYHLGVSSDREFDGKSIHLSLTPNPSHLEAVDPVVAGKVRAKQTILQDKTTDKVFGILIHGDAAMAGQGVVAETFAMSQLRGFRTGGIIHFVINNQIDNDETLVIMDAFEMSLNVMALGGLTVAIGVLVDDAIITRLPKNRLLFVRVPVVGVGQAEGGAEKQAGA